MTTKTTKTAAKKSTTAKLTLVGHPIEVGLVEKKAVAKVAQKVVAELKHDAKAMNDAAAALSAKVTAAPEKKAKAPKAEKKETVASFMRRLIGEGKTNEEVFAAAVKTFGIGEEKKHYPSWYRSQLKRNAKAEKGETKAAAPAKAAKKGKELPNVEKVATKKVAKGPRTVTIMSTTKA